MFPNSQQTPLDDRMIIADLLQCFCLFIRHQWAEAMQSIQYINNIYHVRVYIYKIHDNKPFDFFESCVRSDSLLIPATLSRPRTQIQMACRDQGALWGRGVFSKIHRNMTVSHDAFATNLLFQFLREIRTLMPLVCLHKCQKKYPSWAQLSRCSFWHTSFKN